MDLPARVREDFGIPLIGAHPTGLGADARSATYRGVCADGSAYAVKTSTAAQSGLEVADVLASQGVPGVAAPVRALDGSLAVLEDGVWLSVVPWLDGRRALDGGMTPAQWQQLGRLLALVHDVDPRLPALRDLPVVSTDCAGLVAAARAMGGRLAVLGDEDPLAAELRVLWREHQDAVLAVADRAEALAHTVADTGGSDVVCHTDPHQGNIVVGADDTVWLLDWDDAVRAPREADLMFALGGVLAFAPVTTREQDGFFDGYGSRDWEPGRMTYFQCLRALDDVLSWAEDVVATTRQTQARRAALDIVHGILSPAGLVARALAEQPSPSPATPAPPPPGPSRRRC